MVTYVNEKCRHIHLQCLPLNLRLVTDEMISSLISVLFCSVEDISLFKTVLMHG